MGIIRARTTARIAPIPEHGRIRFIRNCRGGGGWQGVARWKQEQDRGCEETAMVETTSPGSRPFAHNGTSGKPRSYFRSHGDGRLSSLCGHTIRRGHDCVLSLCTNKAYTGRLGRMKKKIGVCLRDESGCRRVVGYAREITMATAIKG